jgi:hypothetical protein
VRWAPVPHGWFPTRRLHERTTRALRQAPMPLRRGSAVDPVQGPWDTTVPPTPPVSRPGNRACPSIIVVDHAGGLAAGPMPADLTVVAASRAPRGERRQHTDGGESTSDRPSAARGCHAPDAGGHTGQEAHLGDHRPAVAVTTARTSLAHPVMGTTTPFTRPLACWTRRSQASSPARSAASGSWRAFVLEASV